MEEVYKYHIEDKMEWLMKEFPNLDEVILEDILVNEANGEIFAALDIIKELYPHMKKKNIKDTPPPKIVKDAIEYFKTKPKSEYSRIDVWNWVFDRVDKNSGYPPKKFQFERWYLYIMCNALDGK